MGQHGDPFGERPALLLKEPGDDQIGKGGVLHKDRAGDVGGKGVAADIPFRAQLRLVALPRNSTRGIYILSICSSVMSRTAFLD